MGEAKYGEPWSACNDGQCTCGMIWAIEGSGHIATTHAKWGDHVPVVTKRGRRKGEEEVRIELYEYGDNTRDGQIANTRRIVACVNALSGVANVEALGALLTLAQEVADESHLVCVGPSCFHLECRMKFALAALYAPQASEAKPL